MATMGYAIKVTEKFAKEFKKKHKDKLDWLKKTKKKLFDCPECGKPLRGRLDGTWQTRVGPFRLWYELTTSTK